MKLSWVKTHGWIKKIFSNYVWDVPNAEYKIYLTFDDGPTPEITNWTLNQLSAYNAKATFFCIGDNIRKFPEIFNQVVASDHAIGNHTYHHVNGWKTETNTYIKNAILCQMEIEKNHVAFTPLFRPPYGKIKRKQSKKLRQSGYKIIMWDILSEDYDGAVTKEKCLENVLNNIQAGSIIVFHDSIKAFPHLEFVLPKVLEFGSKKGFVFEAL